MNSTRSQAVPPLPEAGAARAAARGLPRLDGAEWLDQGYGSDADVAANLAEMWRINRWLGGLRALTRHLCPRLAAAAGPLAVVDVGTGSADVLAALARRMRRRGAELRLIGLDASRRVLAVARKRTQGSAGPGLLQADALHLPLAPRSADYVISSLFMHHLAPEALAELLRGAFTVARRGIVMTDLVRGRLPLLAFRLAQPVFARQALTRHDGAMSIRRAYTPAELRAVAGRAGLPDAKVHVHWPWRMTLVADRAATPGRGERRD